MTIKHISRDYSAHKKNIIRPYDEYVGLEIFSFDPKYTKTYLPSDNTLKVKSNAIKTSWKSWSCYKVSNEVNSSGVEYENTNEDMVFSIPYNVVEDGDYRLDFLYEQSNHIHTINKDKNTGADLVGALKIDSPISTVYDEDILFDGENNILKRKYFINKLNKGKHTITISVPHNCYFIGVIIRKQVKYYANNYFGDNSGKNKGNMMLTSATLTISDMTKPSELTCEIGYNDLFECEDSPSGFFIDYMDEVNYYVKDNDGDIERVFGGYISSILPDSDRTKLSIHCADRLVDGQNKYILDQMVLQKGTVSQSNDEYTDAMTKNFNTYGQALKYLCDVHEVTLNSNISKNFLVDGEKYSQGFSILFGKKKNIKKVTTSNCLATSYDNFIMLRNNPSSSKKQVWTLYDASKVAKKPPLLNNRGYIHITYGIGSPKTEIKTKITEKVDVSDTTAGSQKFTKCGVSADKKYIMAIGLPSAPNDSKKGWTKTVFERKCPHCGSTNLVYDIFYGGSSGWGHAPCRGATEGGGVEGHIFCKSCDADYSAQGNEHISGSKYKLKKASSTTASSKAEAQKLKNGQLSQVPTSNVQLTPDQIFQAITNLAFKYKYKLGGASSYSQMKKSGSGDCHAFSDLIFTELKKYGVTCKIVRYKTNASNNHRSVLYANSKNKWVDFPYREYGWDTRYKNMLNNTGGSKTGSLVAINKGSNIASVKAKNTTSKTETTTITTTKGYDKDKPFQGYLKIVYSNTNSFNGKKKNLYIKFSHTANEKNSLNIANFPLYWINNSTRKSTLQVDGSSFNIVNYIRNINNSNEDVYLQSIQMIAPVVKQTTDNQETDWYKSDKSTIDESSCKLNLYQITFNNNQDVNAKELNSCGKSVNEMIRTLVDDTGYLVDMSFGLHRKDDRINFRVNNNSNPSFTATEGDNNNILSWNSISYSPLTSLFNSSIQVFKDLTDKANYYYVGTHSIDSVLNYQEHTTLQTSNESIDSTEAYYNARMNSNFNDEQLYNYSITVPNYPQLKLGDLVKVVANARKLSNIKELKSIKISFDKGKMPRIRTELGLGELAPDIQLKSNIRKLRSSAKKDTTSFSSSAIPVNKEEIYMWDN